MRYFPPCNEGFRRLSLVVAALVFVLAFGRWVRDDLHTEDSLKKICLTIHLDQEQSCYGGRDVDACIQKADNDYSRCVANTKPKLFNLENIVVWLAYIVGALFFAYLATFAVRGSAWIVHWITQGFKA